LARLAVVRLAVDAGVLAAVVFFAAARVGVVLVVEPDAVDLAAVLAAAGVFFAAAFLAPPAPVVDAPLAAFARLLATAFFVAVAFFAGAAFFTAMLGPLGVLGTPGSPGR